MKDAIMFTVWRDQTGDWRWHGKRNGKVTCESGEGYKRRVSAEKSLKNMLAAIFDGRYEIYQPDASEDDQ